MTSHDKPTSLHDTVQERRRLWQKRLVRETREERCVYEDSPYPDSARVIAAKLLLKALGLYRRGMHNALTPRLRNIVIMCEGLPQAFDGFRILHLSDFHFDLRLDVTDTVCSLLKDVSVDLCVLTGDYRFNQGASRKVVYAGLRRIVNVFRSRHGTVGILGNNDVGTMLEPLGQLGVRMLVNEGFAIAKDDAAIWLAGVDDPHSFGCASIPAALDGVPGHAFRVLLAHSPELIECAVKHRMDIYLCGHTHGGQICLPGIGPIMINARCARRYAAGLWKCGTTQGFTTTGLGVSTLPTRFNCPPEAAVIELRRTLT